MYGMNFKCCVSYAINLREQETNTKHQEIKNGEIKSDRKYF